MDVYSVLVTGANRGIGLEIVRQLVQLPKPPKHIFATYRSRDGLEALEGIADGAPTTQVVLIKMDVTNDEEIKAARTTIEDVVKDSGLTLLVNNAGAVKYQGFPDVTEENMLFHFTTNTMGPIKVLKEMLPLLQKAAANKADGMSVSRAAVLNISSMGGSMADLTPEQPKEWLGVIGYRTSKAALNMAMRVVAFTVKDQGILVVQMCPGWVRTDMGTDMAQISVSESVSAILNTLPQLNESHQGTFIDRNGKTIRF